MREESAHWRGGAFRRQLEAEQGSALLMVLLVTLLVTSLALFLTFVTEIEMQLGGAERVITTGAYAAESGIHAALGAIMVTHDWGGEKFALVEGPLGSDRLIGSRVITSRVQGVGPPQAPPLTIANEGEGQYHSFSVVLTSVAQRVSWPDTDSAPIYEDGDLREDEVTIQAQTSQTVRYFLSPIRVPSTADEIYNSDGAVAVN